jgi:hypothetical protein
MATRHPHLADAMAAGAISPSWVHRLDWLTRKLPAELRAGTDQILLQAAAAGASFDDLTLLANAAVEQYLAQQPSEDGDGFDERFVQVQATFGKAGCVRGNLTPECTAAVEAVLESMGKKHGPEDHRTAGQRYRDALQEACAVLPRVRGMEASGSGNRVLSIVAYLVRELAIIMTGLYSRRYGDHPYYRGEGTDRRARRARRARA